MWSQYQSETSGSNSAFLVHQKFQAKTTWSPRLSSPIKEVPICESDGKKAISVNASDNMNPYAITEIRRFA